MSIENSWSNANGHISTFCFHYRHYFSVKYGGWNVPRGIIINLIRYVIDFFIIYSYVAYSKIIIHVLITDYVFVIIFSSFFYLFMDI